MNIFRNILLWASKNKTLKNYLPSFYFVNKAVKKFMPGEDLKDAVNAAKKLQKQNIGTVFTYLGENLTNISEAEKVRDHYLEVLETIAEEKLNTEISVKLTQLGLDLSFDKAMEFFVQIAEKAKDLDNFVWIDMEGSKYTDVTLDFTITAHSKFSNCGVCVQAYLKRTNADVEKLMTHNIPIRIVKGAYKELPDISFKKKSDVDRNYLELSEMFINNSQSRLIIGTHDLNIVNIIKKLLEKQNLPKEKCEFHLLYGIKSNEQVKMANEGYNIKVLISYGEAWFSWYMRRLAERPANVAFVLKNIFSR
jgi:proline dehydrogenase